MSIGTNFIQIMNTFRTVFEPSDVISQQIQDVLAARFEERTGMVGLLRPEVATKSSERARWASER